MKWGALAGAALGIIADDLLKSAGLHWLVWPVLVPLLLVLALGAGAMWRRSRQRS